MKRDLVAYIQKNKLPCVILSPHFDDAYLSCGGLIAKLSGKTELTIVNVFTKAHTKGVTLSAKKALMDAQCKSAQSLYKARANEDKKVFSHYKVKVLNLGLQEALFRKRKNFSLLGKLIPEFAHLYPTYRWHVTGKIAEDDYAQEEILEQIKKVLKKKTIVFLPSGIGDHVDHKIVNSLGKDLSATCVYYADFPYTVRLGTSGTAQKNQEKFTLTPNLTEKTSMLQLYKTQFAGLFPDKIVPVHKEIFYWSL